MAAAFDVNVAVFHQLFRDFQLNTFNGLNFIVENINSCEDDLADADEDNSASTGACTMATPGRASRATASRSKLSPGRLPDVSSTAASSMPAPAIATTWSESEGRPLTNALFQLPGRRLSNSNAVDR